MTYHSEDKIAMMIWRSIVVTFVFCIAMLCIIFFVATEKQTNWGTKSCELSEISPDFTSTEKAECRTVRSKK